MLVALWKYNCHLAKPRPAGQMVEQRDPAPERGPLLLDDDHSDADPAEVAMSPSGLLVFS